MSKNYSQSKIYEIICEVSGKRYIGSTCETLLSKRLAGHKSCYKRWVLNRCSYYTSFEILKGEKFYINLLELCPCSCKDELLKKEREWIKKLECVNKNIPLRSSAEYYQDNIESITAYKSNIVICGCGGQYRTDNKCHHIATSKHLSWEIEMDLKEKLIILVEDNFEITELDIEKYLAQENAVI